VSRAVHIDPLLVIVAVLIGINLLGIIGAILGVPIAAGLQMLFVRVVAPAIRRSVAVCMQTLVQDTALRLFVAVRQSVPGRQVPGRPIHQRSHRYGDVLMTVRIGVGTWVLVPGCHHGVAATCRASRRCVAHCCVVGHRLTLRPLA
jgi:hypothetical protein